MGMSFNKANAVEELGLFSGDFLFCPYCNCRMGLVVRRGYDSRVDNICFLVNLACSGDSNCGFGLNLGFVRDFRVDDF